MSDQFAETQLIPGEVLSLYLSIAETYRIHQSTAEGLKNSVAHFSVLQKSAISVIKSIELESQKSTAAEGLTNNVATFPYCRNLLCHL